MTARKSIMVAVPAEVLERMVRGYLGRHVPDARLVKRIEASAMVLGLPDRDLMDPANQDSPVDWTASKAQRARLVEMRKKLEVASQPEPSATPETVAKAKALRNRDPVHYMSLSDVEIGAVEQIRNLIEALGRGLAPSGGDTSRIIVDGGKAIRHPVDLMNEKELWLHHAVFLPWCERLRRRAARGPNSDNLRPSALELTLKVLVDRWGLGECAKAFAMQRPRTTLVFGEALRDWITIHREAAQGRSTHS